MRVPRAWTRFLAAADSRSRGLGHGPGDGLGALKGAADVDAVPVGGHRRKAGRVGKSVMIQFNAEFFRQFQGVLGGLQTHGEHHHVKVFPDLLAVFGHVINFGADILVAGVDAVRPAADKTHPFG